MTHKHKTQSLTNNAPKLLTSFLSGRAGVGLFLLFFLVGIEFSYSQKKKENIGTESVDVVKPYTPIIPDANKPKESPVYEDEVIAKKENVKYTIFPFPVASTFSPSKGKAEKVEKSNQEHLFQNYATLGIGNFSTLNAELFVNQNLDGDQYVGGMLRHLSSRGKIKNVELDNLYYDTALGLNYGANQKDLSWKVDLEYQNQLYNWYGLPTDFGSTLATDARETLMNSINPRQTYNTLSVGGKIDVNESVFSKANFKFNRFSDDYDSAENRFYIKPSFKIGIKNTVIKTNLIVDYVGGSFKNNYSKTNVEPIKYGFTNFGIVPTFDMQEKDWAINIGLGLFYSLDNQGDNSKFLIYPQINASHKIVGDLMIFYAGAEGSLEQNSYLDFVNQNPFLSPTLNIAPTDKQYDVFAGLKGKLSGSVSYNVRGSFTNERNKALFKSNDFEVATGVENYALGNSMQVVYADVRTLSFYGELKADFSENVSFGINGVFNSYAKDLQPEAWNLPAIKLNSTLDFKITPKWFAGFNVFFVGDRKDQKLDLSFNTTTTSPVTLPAYFDANAHVGFKYNERWTAFLKGNNLGNQGYEKWLNFPVQGFQIMVGANYKFDF
jgi:hypothetical protein